MDFAVFAAVSHTPIMADFLIPQDQTTDLALIAGSGKGSDGVDGDAVILEQA